MVADTFDALFYSLLLVLAVHTLLVAVAGWTSGQSMFSGKDNYKSMTELFAPRHRGNIDLPPCIKDILNCWEFINTDVVCKWSEGYVVRLDTICMDLRFQCRETTGYRPFPENRENLFDYCRNAKQKFPDYYVKNDIQTANPNKI